MRFDPDVDPEAGSTSTGPTAAELLSSLSAEELAKVFYEFGEERFSRRIARRIVETRQQAPIQTTRQLAELVRRSVPGRSGTGRSTRRPASSRLCGSRSTTSSASSTRR